MDELSEAEDRAGAALTVPTDIVGREWVHGRARRPAVDPELWALHVRYARHGDDAVLQALVDHYRAHAAAQARRHYRRGGAPDDPPPVAPQGLLSAPRRVASPPRLPRRRMGDRGARAGARALVSRP